MKHDVEFYHDHEFVTVETLRTDPDTGLALDGSAAANGRVLQLRVYATGAQIGFGKPEGEVEIIDCIRLRLGTGLMGVTRGFEHKWMKDVIDPHQFKSLYAWAEQPKGTLLRVIDIVQLTTIQFRR